MNTGNDWQAVFEQELAQGAAARAAGNEGRARVCARRAAGAVVGEFLRRNNLPDQPAGAYDRLAYFRSLPGLPAAIQTLIDPFTARVTVEHTLPVAADLLADARRLRHILLDT